MVIKFVSLFFAFLCARNTKSRENLVASQHFVFVFGDENVFFSRNLSEKAITVESTKSIKIRMPEQSNDYRVVTFGSGGVGKSSLGKEFFNFDFRFSRSSKAKRKNLLVCLSAHVEKRTEGAPTPGGKMFFSIFAFLSTFFGTEKSHARTAFHKSLPDKCFIHYIDTKATFLLSLVDLEIHQMTFFGDVFTQSHPQFPFLLFQC